MTAAEKVQFLYFFASAKKRIDAKDRDDAGSSDVAVGSTAESCRSSRVHMDRRSRMCEDHAVHVEAVFMLVACPSGRGGHCGDSRRAERNRRHTDGVGLR